MKKSFVFVVTFAIFALFFGLFYHHHSVQAQYKKPRKEVKPKGIDEKDYPPAGIDVAGAVIKGGTSLGEVWGILGPPDRISSMRSKNDSKDDYVKLEYTSYGLSIDIGNETNRVKGILIQENSSSLKLVNCPFKIGQNVRAIIKAWGAPEEEEKYTTILPYWKRGVYIGVEKGQVTYIYIDNPGKFKD